MKYENNTQPLGLKDLFRPYVLYVIVYLNHCQSSAQQEYVLYSAVAAEMAP